MRVVSGHSRRPEYSAPAGASEWAGSGPATKCGAPVIDIASRFHVSICIGEPASATGLWTSWTYGGA